jgi:uncharacterized membrane protein
MQNDDTSGPKYSQNRHHEISRGEAKVIRSFGTKSLEAYAAVGLIFGVVMAVLLSLIPRLAFGTMWQMASVFVIAELILYIAIKLRLLRPPRSLR